MEVFLVKLNPKKCIKLKLINNFEFYPTSLYVVIWHCVSGRFRYLTQYNHSRKISYAKCYLHFFIFKAYPALRPKSKFVLVCVVGYNDLHNLVIQTWKLKISFFLFSFKKKPCTFGLKVYKMTLFEICFCFTKIRYRYGYQKTQNFTLISITLD
jgi:hypothetical protein